MKTDERMTGEKKYKRYDKGVDMAKFGIVENVTLNNTYVLLILYKLPVLICRQSMGSVYKFKKRMR